MKPHTLLAAVIAAFDILSNYLMSITRGVLAYLLSQRFMIKCLTVIQIELEFGNVGFFFSSSRCFHTFPRRSPRDLRLTVLYLQPS